MCDNPSILERLFYLIFLMYAPPKETPLYRAMQNMEETQSLWLNSKDNFKSEDVIKLLIEYGAKTNDYDLSTSL